MAIKELTTCLELFFNTAGPMIPDDHYCIEAS